MIVPTDAIPIGSQVFFSSYPDFVSHDADYLYIVDTSPFPFIDEDQFRRIAVRGQGVDLIYMKRQPKEVYLQDALKEPNQALILGKFLVPAFINSIGLTIEDLSTLQSLVDNLDTKHQYEAIIYNAYLTNHDFVLTQSQRDAAYQSYKEARKKGV